MAYVAGLIERKILTQASFNCVDCREVFYVNEKIDGSLFKGKTGPIHIPCKTTYTICYISNIYLKILAKDACYTHKKLISDIWHQIDFGTAYAKTNFEGHESHKEYFIQIIIEEFVRKQANYIAKKITLNMQGRRLRQVYKKHVHRCGH